MRRCNSSEWCRKTKVRATSGCGMAGGGVAFEDGVGRSPLHARLAHSVGERERTTHRAQELLAQCAIPSTERRMTAQRLFTSTHFSLRLFERGRSSRAEGGPRLSGLSRSPLARRSIGARFGSGVASSIRLEACPRSMEPVQSLGRSNLARPSRGRKGP